MNTAPKQFVTIDELHKILSAYDRYGTAEVEAGKVEDRIRKMIHTSLDEKIIALHFKIRSEISLSTDKAAIEARSASQAAAQQVTADLHKTFDNLIKKLKDSLMGDLVEHIKIRTNDIQSQTLAKINAIADSSKKDLISQHEAVWNDLKNSQKEFASDISHQAKSSVMTLVAESEKEISDETKSYLKIHTQNVTNLFEQFKIYLTEQLKSKLVDKQAVEQKMRDIENDLYSRANQIIDTHVQQARAQMESSAKAEVKEGMRDAASQLIGLLGQ